MEQQVPASGSLRSPESGAAGGRLAKALTPNQFRMEQPPVRQEPPVSPDAIPYCGPAPLPADLWLRWNLDPWLLLALTLPALAYALGPARQVDRAQRSCFTLGWVLLAVIFVSPLCALTSA